MSTNTTPVISKPLVERIIQATCIHFGCLEKELTSKNQTREIVYYRKLCYYLIRQNCSFGYGRIAIRFGFSGTSHSHVMKHIEDIEAQKNIYRHIMYDLEKIMKISSILEQSPTSAYSYGMDNG